MSRQRGKVYLCAAIIIHTRGVNNSCRQRNGDAFTERETRSLEQCLHCTETSSHISSEFILGKGYM